MIDDEAEVRDLEAQMGLAMEGVRKAVLRLLQDGEVHTQLVTLAVVRIAGELGAASHRRAAWTWRRSWPM